MKKAVLYITIFFALCLALKAQGQTPVIEFQEKLTSLSAISLTASQILHDRINGTSGSIFMNTSEQADKYEVAGEVLKVMYIKTANDITTLVNEYGSQLNSISILNIEWAGTGTFVLPQNLTTILPDLQYVYIRSYKNLSSSLITNAFQSLLSNLDYDEDGIEVLYENMEQSK